MNMVETNGNLASELEVLLLVFADGYMGCAVKEDVGGLKHRVRKEAELEGRIIGWGLLG